MTEAQRNYHSPAALVKSKNKKITDWSCCYIPLCHKYINLLIETFKSRANKKEVNILDIGCGNGQFTKYLYNVYNEDNVNLTGCDISEKHINLAQEIHSGPQYILVPKILDGSLPFEDNSFDVIVCNFVISCINDNNELQLYLKEINRILNGSNGVFLLTINNPAEIIDTRFSGIQCCSSSDDHGVKAMDNVTLKFYDTIVAKEPYYVAKEVWRPKEMIQNMLTNAFTDKQCNVTNENLNHKNKFDFYVKQLNMDPTLLILEHERYPFTVFIVEAEGVYTETQKANNLLIGGYMRSYNNNSKKILGLIYDFFV